LFDAHKGTFGRVLVCAGSSQYLGAAYLCCAAAARAGAGIVACLAAAPLQAVVATRLPEATYVPLPAGPPDRAGEAAFEAVRADLPQWSALVVGPGLARTPETERFLERLLAERAERCPTQPLVLDADALYHLARHPEWWQRLGPSAILTPHHGEMARLLGATVQTVSAEPWGVAGRAATQHRVTIVLKGPHTVVAAPDGSSVILPHPNPALATGGTGDVLAGTIGGLLAQGVPPQAAAAVAVYVHGAAAHHCLAATGRDLLLASDLPTAIADALAQLRAERGEWSAAATIPWEARL
jgi:NAD(P)H-hydrate epimerase